MSPEKLALSTLLPHGAKVLCAVSGGADSMCLLHLLWSERAALGITVLAAHYEHGLRGEESRRDADFVSRWCAERDIPCALRHGDVRAFAETEGLGIEEAARRLRYDFLECTADALGCDRIATAHNADDNAETLLLNLLRGSGAAGLSGIPPARGRIVRPLLACTRAEIERYLERHGVAHVEDGSNDSDDFTRNRLRHQVMPVLRELNPAFSETALRTSRLLRRDEDFLRDLAEDFAAAHFDGESLLTKELLALHPAVASRVVRLLCGRGLSEGHTADVLAFCGGRGLAYLDLPGRRLRREQGRLYLTSTEPETLPERILVPGAMLAIPEAGLVVRADETVCEQEIYDLFKTLNFKSEKLCGKVILCTGRRSGDTIRPAGRGCTKSLKDLFLESGVSWSRRALVPVFRDEAGILAVYGLAVDERVFARPGDRVLRLQIENTEKS